MVPVNFFCFSPMPCFSPILAWQLKVPGSKSRIFFHYVPHTQEIKIPCGRCIGCRLEKSRQWAARCVFEATKHKDNCFITLTYSDENLPFGKSLDPYHLEKFWKRLRKKLGPDHKIKYFAAGEYGETTKRPHYHAIVFGWDPRRNFESPPPVADCNCFLDTFFNRPSKPALAQSARLSTIKTENGVVQINRSEELENLWGLGMCAVGSVSFNSAAYVARYCLKKILGNPALAREVYGGRIPEFSRMSKGLAKDWFDDYKDNIYSIDRIVVRGHECKPPRYFDKLLEKENPELLEQVKKDRENVPREEEEISRLIDRATVLNLRMKKFARDF